jgi:hypothetical protein
MASTWTLIDVEKNNPLPQLPSTRHARGQCCLHAVHWGSHSFVDIRALRSADAERVRWEVCSVALLVARYDDSAAQCYAGTRAGHHGCSCHARDQIPVETAMRWRAGWLAGWLVGRGSRQIEAHEPVSAAPGPATRAEVPTTVKLLTQESRQLGNVPRSTVAIGWARFLTGDRSR